MTFARGFIAVSLICAAGVKTRRLFEFSAALLFDNANGSCVSKRIGGDYAVAIGHDDCARLREAAIRVLLPSLAGNLVEIVGPNLDVVGFGLCHAA
jgi:hypothetical protein